MTTPFLGFCLFLQLFLLINLLLDCWFPVQIDSGEGHIIRIGLLQKMEKKAQAFLFNYD